MNHIVDLPAFVVIENTTHITNILNIFVSILDYTIIELIKLYNQRKIGRLCRKHSVPLVWMENLCRGKTLSEWENKRENVARTQQIANRVD